MGGPRGEHEKLDSGAGAWVASRSMIRQRLSSLRLSGQLQVHSLKIDRSSYHDAERPGIMTLSRTIISMDQFAAAPSVARVRRCGGNSQGNWIGSACDQWQGFLFRQTAAVSEDHDGTRGGGGGGRQGAAQKRK